MAGEPLSSELLGRLSDAIFQGRKIDAIKIHREATGMGLRESKEEVEAIAVRLRQSHPEKFALSRPDGGSGCLGAVVLFISAAACVTVTVHLLAG
ncbi:ribosomal protein L7/L12 [Planctomyces sp. SH-PL14]|uniref:ribosomal protein L7/L12 n=1 Tax=Planctomyces sp. SH-PL14 TaxID=1632864 RepID=UPI00078E6CE9|nr:ribosomal protein L7/L12 [Planctomyces sp. SH-PL14]AMV19820.1 hypothetical protein VT03_18120 [Planctomyces sp. SH-PL14]